MKSAGLSVVLVCTVAACSPTVVPTQRGIGFDDAANRAAREAALSAQRESIVPTPQVNTVIADGPLAVEVQNQAIAASELAQAGIGQAAPAAVPNLGADPLRTQGLDASPANAQPVLSSGSDGLSDEQNFDAVSGRETIESDAERRAAQAAAREQIAPTALPDRPSNVGPNIVEYALSAPNAKGQEWYSRSLLSGEGRFRRNCAGYATPDDAQRDFLARGGPERDRRGIDPDGDGFACGWDPAPFIAAFQN